MLPLIIVFVASSALSSSSSSPLLLLLVVVVVAVVHVIMHHAAVCILKRSLRARASASSTRVCARVEMPWFGVILWRWSHRGHGTPCREYCVQFDRKRKGYELPKGGAEVLAPRRIAVPTLKGTRTWEVYDSSPFATARWELWEETGVWVGWRAEGTYTWISKRGCVLPGGPSDHQDAWLCTQARSTADAYDIRRAPTWMSIDEFARQSTRDDHLGVLRSLQTMPKHP